MSQSSASRCSDDDDVLCLGEVRQRQPPPSAETAPAVGGQGRSRSDRPKSDHQSPARKKAASDHGMKVRNDHVEPVYDQLLDVVLHNNKYQTILEEGDCNNNGKHPHEPIPFHERTSGVGRERKFALANDKQAYKWAIAHVIAKGMDSSRAFKELYDNEGGDGENSIYVGFEHHSTSILNAIAYVDGKPVIDIKKLQRMPEEFRGVFQYRFQNPIGGGYFSIDDLLSERIAIIDLIFFAWFAKSWNGRIVEDLTLDHLFDVLGDGPGFVINYNCGSGPSIVPKLVGGGYGEKNCRKLVFGLIIPTRFLLSNCYAKVLRSERLLLRMAATEKKIGWHPFTATPELRAAWKLHKNSVVLDFFEMEEYEEKVMECRRAGRKDRTSVPTCESSFFRDVCASWKEQKRQKRPDAAGGEVVVILSGDDDDEMGEEVEQDHLYNDDVESANRYSTGELANMKDAARPSNELRSKIQAARQNQRDEIELIE